MDEPWSHCGRPEEAHHHSSAAKNVNSHFEALAKQYRGALLNDVIPFWERHSVDREHGGYFTCLDREGAVYDSDKFVWLQARQVWTFSMLFNEFEPRDEWLEIARHGASFLGRHGRDQAGDWYFSLVRDGRPLTQPYNIFSDCYAAMAFSRFAVASGEDSAREIAEQTYQKILRRRENPKGRYNKAVSATRPSVSLSIPMMIANITMELEGILDLETFDRTLDQCLEQIFGLFLDDQRQILHEHVGPDGAKLDCFEGRAINPGHGIEAMWFIMDVAERRGDAALLQKAVTVALRTLEFGWDDQYGGIFSFLDVRGRPPQQLEWDRKLWWVHVETLVALLKGYRLTGNPACLKWFEKVHSYVWSHFPDPKHGEWFGYLTRQGEVLLPLKGGKWKGCFHVPRGLYLGMRECEILAARQPAGQAVNAKVSNE